MLKTAILFFIAIACSGVSATFDGSNFLFKSNFGADQSLMEHARTASGAASHDKFQYEDAHLESTGPDLCDPEYFNELFRDLTFRPEEYTRYKGLDHTSLFASSVTLSDKYAVIGSNGYDIFKGIVHVYAPKSATKWSLQALIRSPVWDNANFGNDVAIDDERLIIAANAYNKYDGIVFIYERNPEHACWVLEGTIKSPLAADPDNKTDYQGFGYRVDLSGDFAIIGTSVNNAYIYKEVSPGNWVLHTDLPPPAPGIFFGRSVALEGNIALVGAYGYGGSVGRVYVYQYNDTTDSWGSFGFLSAPRNHSGFGFSVDIHGTNIVVGANGFVAGQFENKPQFDARNTQQSVNPGWAYVYFVNEEGTGYELDAEIASPVGNNSYFGAGVGIYEDAIIVGADGFPCHGLIGSGFVFTRDPVSGHWGLNQSYPSPAGTEGHFGYAVDIAKNFSVIGAYGFDDLRGAVYLAERPVVITPAPTPYPTAEPTFAPTNPAEILSGGGLTRKVGNTKLTLGMVLALALGVLILAAATGLICYCCCCMVPIIPLLKKKKKKEEENSPYTVHSYAGYIEEDEYIAPVVLIDEKLKEKEKEKSVTFMEDGTVRKMFPYKVYGPRGYSEGDNETVPDELLERKKEAEHDEVVTKPHANDDNEDEEEQYEMHLRAKINNEAAQAREAGNIHQVHVDHARRNLQSYRAEQAEHQSTYSTITGPSSVVSSRRSSLSSMRDEADHDDDTVLSESTELSRGSLVEQAKAKYSRFSREHSSSASQYESTAAGSSNLVSAAKAKYASMSRSRSLSQNAGDDQTVQTTSTGSSGLSYVESAKMRYADMKRGTSSSSSNMSSSAASNGGESSELSLVERTKLRYAAMRSSSDMSSASSDQFHQQTQSTAVRVSAAREKYEALQSTTVVHNSSGKAGEDEDDQTVLSRNTTSTTSSAVEQARAKYAKLRRNREEALAGDQQSVASGSTQSQSEVSAEPASLVDSIKARYTAQQTTTTTTSHVTTSHTSSSSKTAYVETAKSQYASMGDDATVASQGSQGSSKSLVEAAKAKYANLKKSRDDTSSSSVETGTSVDAAKANYLLWKEQNATTTTTAATTSTSFTSSSKSEHHSSSTKEEHFSQKATTVAAADGTDASQASEGSSSATSSVDATRKAAMAKFALYKAKAESEAAKVRSAEQDTAVQVMLRERNATLVRKAAAEEDEDRSIEEAVEAARLRAERLQIDARDAVPLTLNSESTDAAQRDAEREAAKARAQAKARENFARLKARTEAQQLQQTSANAVKGDGDLHKAMSDARAKLQRSADVLAEEVPAGPPADNGASAVPEVRASYSATTTSSTVQRSAVSRKVESSVTSSKETTSTKSAATSSTAAVSVEPSTGREVE